MSFLLIALFSHATADEAPECPPHATFEGCGAPALGTVWSEVAGYEVSLGTITVQNDAVDLAVTVGAVPGLLVADIAVWLGDPALAPADPSSWTYTEPDPCLEHAIRIPLTEVSPCTDVTVYVRSVALGGQGEVVFEAVGLETIATCLHSCGAEGAACEEPTDAGLYRTQTQGGWGTKAAGGNPGTYRDAHFAGAFPAGLTVGCGTHALSFTSSGDIEDTLPSGGKPGALHETVTNPGKYKNTLVGQVVALTLSVGFDAHDPDFGTANSSLAGLRLTDGDYVDWTIAAVLERANDVLGGCLPGEEASDLNHALSVINENFVDGTTLGTSLSCP